MYSQDVEVIPLLVVASTWYLALTTVLPVGQYILERRFGRAPPAGPARGGGGAPGEGVLSEDHR